MNSVKVLGLKTHPILQLLVSRPEAVDHALCVEGQSAVESFHLTLARTDVSGVVIPLGLQFPEPPASIDLTEDVRLVNSAEKRSCYSAVSESGQQALKDYVRQCEAAASATLLDESRVFHVTLTNAGGGAVRASVGAVWEHPSVSVSRDLKEMNMDKKSEIDASIFALEQMGSMSVRSGEASLAVVRGGTDLPGKLPELYAGSADKPGMAHFVQISDAELSPAARAEVARRFAASPLLQALGDKDYATTKAEHYDEPQADGSRIRRLRIF